MTPEQAKDIIADLIEKHGPDYGETGHIIVIRGGRPMILDNNMRHDPHTDTFVCDVVKSGMKHGFTTALWNKMSNALAKAVNETET